MLRSSIKAGILLTSVVLVIPSTICAQKLPTPPRGASLADRDDPRKLEWEEVAVEDVDMRIIMEDAQRMLGNGDLSWNHAQSEHFAVHFEREIFARKVARMAEFYYQYIAEDLPGVVDIYDDKRSHILVFKDEDRWVRYANPPSTWTFSYVHGTCMYLQQAKNTRDSADVLAHEMTHLVLNRFFRRPIPRWFNEGLAEWYGEFAYSAFKGTKKSKRTQFRKIKRPYDLNLLLNAEHYPSATRDVHAFYETSKFLVAYLRLEWPEETFQAFMKTVMDGAPLMSAIEQHYGISDIEELKTGFRKFAGIR